MKRKKVFLIIGFMVFLGASVYATTTITNDQISTKYLDIESTNGNRGFVLSKGNFNHRPGYFEEVSCLKYNESGGTVPYFNSPRDVFVVGKYAYVVAIDSHSLTVIDISNPLNMSEVGVILDDFVNGTAEKLESPKVIFVSGNYAYVTSGGDNALSIIDISNPSNMTEVGYINGTENYLDSPLDIYVYGGYAYIAGAGSNSFVIIDVRDPENPVLVSNVTGSFSGPGGLAISGDYAYLASHDSYHLHVIDISNVSNPHIVLDISDDSVGGNFEGLRDVSQGGLTISGKYLYVASSEDKVSIIDISNPLNLTEVAVINDTSLGGIASLFDNPKKIFIAGKYMYVSSINSDAFSVFDISEPTNVIELGYIQDDNKGGDAECLDRPQGIFISGKYAYVTAKNDNGLSVIDITGIETPSIITGGIQANNLNIIDFVNIAGDLFVKETLNIGSNAWFGKSVSIFKNLDVFGISVFHNNVIFWGNLAHNNNTGISGNYTDGNCWTAYSGGIIYETNCTSA